MSRTLIVKSLSGLGLCVFFFVACQKDPATPTPTNEDSLKFVSSPSPCYPPFTDIYARESFEQRLGGFWEVAKLYDLDGNVVEDAPGHRLYFPTPFKYDRYNGPVTLGVFISADSTIDFFEWWMYGNFFNHSEADHSPRNMPIVYDKALSSINVDSSFCTLGTDSLFFRGNEYGYSLLLVRPK